MISLRSRSASILTLALALIAVLAIAVPSFAAGKAKYPLTIKDSLGETFTLKKEPARIISTSPATTEILFALGLGDKVVGVSSWCDFPAEAKKKERVGSFSEPNVEKIVSLRPDLVLGAAGINRPALKQLDDLGVPVMTCDAKDVNGVMDLIQTVAKATNTVDEGLTLIDSMQKRIDRVVAKVAKVKTKPKVFYELWNNPTMTAGPGTFINDLIRLAGATNIAADAKTDWPMYSLEVIIVKDPDVFIYSHGAETTAQIKARKGWETVKAIKSGNIVLLPDENVVSRPGPRIVDGLEDVAKAIHPELFK